jgi:hypothetical protein
MILYNIVKQSTGNVVIKDATTNLILFVFVNVNALEVKSDSEIIVKFGFNQWKSLNTQQVRFTQIEPAAAVSFSGDAYDLADLLSSSFFFELSGGSQNLSQVLTVGNSAGATDIDLNNNDLLNVDKTTFNLATTETSGVGQLNWNDTDGTLNLGLKGGAVTLQLGQEIVARAVNKTVPLIDLLEANYQVVRVSGAQGQRLAVRLAQSDTEANCQSTLGIVTETILKNQEGFVTVLGQVRQINTTGSLQGETWNDGDVLYLSPTTAGAITKVKPTFPNKIIIVGYVEYAHAVNGKIYANISRLETSIIDIQAAASDETTALTTGTAKVTFRTPAAFTLTGVRASLTTAQASGSIFTVDINQNGSSVLGTKLTIDNTEKTSVTAATPATITTSAILDDAEITVDIDQIGDGTAKGLKITLIGVRV